MNIVQNMVEQFQKRVFNSVIHNKLVYNSCWEDPRLDRELLAIDSESDILMLTSAGCNALDYLFDNPKSIDCVDINPAQNALLELKKAVLSISKYEVLWAMFGQGQYHKADSIYYKQLRHLLSRNAQYFWDHHIDYFFPSASAASFYFRGTSGTVAHIIHKRIKHKGLYDDVLSMLNASSLKEQAYYYETIEPHLWNSFSRWIFNRNATLAMLGVPRSQRTMIDNDIQGSLQTFIQQALRNVFTKQPLYDNYFWRVYLTGSYTRNCCPGYLKEKNFKTIQKGVTNVELTTDTLLHYLKQSRSQYSHVILLDHQDWLAYHHPKKLAETWKLLLAHAKPHAKILFRSAGSTRTFLPDFIHNHVHFDDKKTQRLHTKDRVGTYGSTHLATVI